MILIIVLLLTYILNLTCKKQNILGDAYSDLLRSSNFKLYKLVSSNCVEWNAPDFVLDYDINEVRFEICTSTQSTCGRAVGAFFYSTGCSEDGNATSTYYSDDQCLTVAQINVSYCTSTNCWDEKMACYTDAFIGDFNAAIALRDNFDIQVTPATVEIYLEPGPGYCQMVSIDEMPTLTEICSDNTYICSYRSTHEYYFNICNDPLTSAEDWYLDSNCTIEMIEERCSTVLCNYDKTMDGMLQIADVGVLLLFCCYCSCICYCCICCCCCSIGYFCKSSTVKRDSSNGTRKKKKKYTSSSSSS